MKSRRQRMREMTYEEIGRVARELLVEEGPPAVTINAVARRMGMSGPAIYRYYASHEDLIAGMTADFFRELNGVIAAERVPGQVSLVPMSRALRRWALDNRAEFRMVFANPPVPASRLRAGADDARPANDFGLLFFEEVEAIWTAQPFPVPALSTQPPEMRRQLEAYADATGNRLPPEALRVFLDCWIRLYGLLCMEVLQQIEFAVTDAAPLFDDCLRDLCRMLGIAYED